MQSQLTNNSISELLSGKKIKPALQIISLSIIASHNKVMLYDGSSTLQATFTNALADMLKNGFIKNYSIIKLEDYVLNVISNKKLLMISNAILINGNLKSKIQVNSSQNNYNNEPLLTDDNIDPVLSLTPYRYKWKIKVRCILKSSVRSWKSAIKSGKVMNIELVDNNTEIRATMFNEVIDKFENVFEVGKVYLISNGRVKVANKRFSRIKNDYEIVIDNSTLIVPVQEDSTLKNAIYNFSKIEKIENLNEGDFVDLYAIVGNVHPLSTVMSNKQNKEINKRIITIADETGKIDLTLWEAEANKYNEDYLKNHPVIVMQGIRVSKYGGKSLSYFNSKIELNPNIPEKESIKSWWESKGKSEFKDLKSLSSEYGSISNINDNDKRVTINEISNNVLSDNNNAPNPLYVIKGTITKIMHDHETRPPFYMACTNDRNGRSCNKKVNEVNDASNEYWCEVCNKTTEAKERYILRFVINDHTGSFVMSCFDEIGEKIIGVPAVELAKLCSGPLQNETTFDSILLNATFHSKLFKIKQSVESYKDEERLRCTVIAMDDIDYVKDSVKLIEQINMIN